jgi:hypothetical protein
VAEVTPSGEEHGDRVFIGGGYHFVVPYRSPGLDDRHGPGFDGGIETVSEREESIRGAHGSKGLVPCTHGGELRGVHATHLPCADAYRSTLFRQDDRIRLHVLRDDPREPEVCKLF